MMKYGQQTNIENQKVRKGKRDTATSKQSYTANTYKK